MTAQQITLPSSAERVEELQQKLLEYALRLHLRREAGRPSGGTFYRTFILSILLEEGSVEVTELLQRLSEAWLVIDDYVETGGVNVEGGTGLPGR